ncbi:MAG: penicillin-binding transpeptidase domain-containing protein [Clostridia bacterium]|nr:penicillin-binding transpeptidase domain-containing protein [Clostridia bacterium]
MHRISNRSKWLSVLIILFMVGVIFLGVTLTQNSKRWATLKLNNHLYVNGEFVSAGTIYDRQGKVLAETKNGKRMYSSDPTTRKSTLHAVGDSKGFIATGAHTAFKPQLIGYDYINGIYKLKKDGGEHDLTLTIDAALSNEALKALGKNKGTVGIINYKTGEILCMVSTPTFDPENPPYDLNLDETGKYEGIYINRFLSGVFTPGSTFKTVTTASVLENIQDIDDRSFDCRGRYTLHKGSYVNCNAVHGNVDFQRAFSRSCNTAYAGLAVELGNEQLTKTAEELYFNKRIYVNGIPVAKSKFDLSNAYPIDRAWAGIGQYTTLANPCHLCLIMSAIANNGTAVAPTIIKDSRAPKLQNLKMLDANVASTLDMMLRTNVIEFYKDRRLPDLLMAGKTGTAEVANDKPHSLFVGYSKRQDLPLAIVVVLQNEGVSGYASAVPVANQVLQFALSNKIS